MSNCTGLVVRSCTGVLTVFSRKLLNLLFSDANGGRPFKSLNSEKKAFLGLREEGDILFAEQDQATYYNARYECNIAHVQLDLQPRSSHLMLRKHSPLTPHINRAIRRNRMKILNIWRTYTEDDIAFSPPCKTFRLGDPMGEF